MGKAIKRVPEPSVRRYCTSNGFHSHPKLGFLKKVNIPFRIKRKGIDEQNSSIPSVLAES